MTFPKPGNLSVNRLRMIVEARHEDATRARATTDLEAEIWKASEKKYLVSKEMGVRAEWRVLYLHLAEVHFRLAEEHRQKADRFFT